MFLEISQSSEENNWTKVSFLIRLAQVFFCEFNEISKIIFFTEHLLLSKLLSKYEDPSKNCCKTISNQSTN